MAGRAQGCGAVRGGGGNRTPAIFHPPSGPLLLGFGGTIEDDTSGAGSGFSSPGREDGVARYRAEYIENTGDNTMGLVATLLEEGRQKGRHEGRQEGRQVGRQEGEAELLLRLLELRFGPLADALRERIRSADVEALLLWSERILTAATPEDVVKE